MRGPDGSVHRFAGGTKAGFAVERINSSSTNQRQGRALFIEATRHGGVQEEEQTVTFGPDVELHAHNGWILRTAMDADMSKYSGNRSSHSFIQYMHTYLHMTRIHLRTHKTTFTYTDRLVCMYVYVCICV